VTRRALSIGPWRKAQTQAGKALDIEGSNEKALYRRAQAAVEVEELEEARADVKKLLVGPVPKSALVPLQYLD
jgi:hypothetical protein